MAPMTREQGWLLVMAVGLVAIAVGLIGAWQLLRHPAPNLSPVEQQALYDSNLRNFSESCEGRAALPEAGGLLDFCRRQAQLLRRMPECDAECQRRTSSFAEPEPSR